MEKANYNIKPRTDATSDEDVRDYIRGLKPGINREVGLQRLKRAGGKCSPGRFSACWEVVMRERLRATSRVLSHG